MDDTFLSALSDAQVLGLTGAAEARAYLDPIHGWSPAPIGNMIAVMATAINRVHAAPNRFGATVAAACLAPKQYSCWNVYSGSNHDWLLAQIDAVVKGRGVAPIVQQCIAAAVQLLDGAIADPVAEATHYYAPLSMVPPGRVPDWAVGKTPVATSGDHLFFKGV